MRYLTALCCASLLLNACDSPAGPGRPGGATRTVLSTSVLLDLQTSGLDAPRRLVFQDESGWARFWNQATRHLSPQPELPAVDFNTSMVIAAAMGRRATDGHDIRIERVSRDDGQLLVLIRQISPGQDCPTASLVTSPVVAVRTSRTEATVRFEIGEMIQSCR